MGSTVDPNGVARQQIGWVRPCVAGLAGVLLLSALPSGSTQTGALRAEAKQAAAIEPFKEQPDLFVRDVRTFFAKIGPKRTEALR